MAKTAIVVVADFYRDIAAALLESCERELDKAGLAGEVKRVGGALEIPPALQFFAAQQPFCMVALGCVIRGETYHFEVVANTSASGIMQVQLQTGVAIGNGVLTVENRAQAVGRVDKGADAAAAAIALARLLNA